MQRRKWELVWEWRSVPWMEWGSANSRILDHSPNTHGSLASEGCVAALSTTAMSVQTGKTQYPPLSSLHAHPQSTSTVITVNTHSKRARGPQLAVQPPAQQHCELDTYRLHILPTLPHAHFPISLMATSRIISPDLLLTRARLRPPSHSTMAQSRIVSLAVGVDDVPLQQPQRQSRAPSLPHDTRMICARCH
jgi:hypothetical protein